ncbi:MAG: DNA mismatch repair endonuclease MutL [Isosphaeraceae bacterium]|nr:DNA mismatch repair endonuclease MutL [Isosphaeraceae bacterium]
MGIIRELPPSVINQIAAGEVVERPASVVKELLENAIDAGATRIEVTVERGGKDLVRVADDGKGMDRDDLALAFKPHATSKLAGAEDLHRITTLGFRGEALAAIAEVARVRCQSRTAEMAAGAEITIEGGVAGPVRDCGGPPGTVIEVRNLFYNTPVRRTFLKSDTTEAGHVAEMFTRIALAHPTVHLTLRSGGKVVYDLPSVTGLRERVAVFFGQELADALLWVESRIESTHLWGYVAHPSQSRSSTKGQYLFIGGRYVRDRSLAHALSEAYRGLLMVGRMPVAFLYLEIPPEEVDVNVHPTKIEVRFRDSHRVYSQLLSTIRQTFLASDLHARLQVPVPSPAESEPVPSAIAEESLAIAARPAERQAVASWSEPASRAGPAPMRVGPADQFDEFEGSRPSPPAESRPEVPVMPPPRPVVEDREPPDARAMAPGRPEPARELPPKALQVHDSYLIAETEDGMVVIDQHALHERILYEELRARVERGGVESQRLLVPEPVDLPAADAAEILQRRAVLARLGIGVEPFGGDTVLVTGLPAVLTKVTPGRLLRDLADHFRSNPLPPTPDALLEDVLNMVACRAAIKAGQPLSPEEIAALLERRHLVANTHHCPHGRPTALLFSKAELERQFGRI